MQNVYAATDLLENLFECDRQKIFKYDPRGNLTVEHHGKMWSWLREVENSFKDEFPFVVEKSLPDYYDIKNVVTLLYQEETSERLRIRRVAFAVNFCDPNEPTESHLNIIKKCGTIPLELLRAMNEVLQRYNICGQNVLPLIDYMQQIPIDEAKELFALTNESFMDDYLQVVTAQTFLMVVEINRSICMPALQTIGYAPSGRDLKNESTFKKIAEAFASFEVSECNQVLICATPFLKKNNYWSSSSFLVPDLIRSLGKIQQQKRDIVSKLSFKLLLGNSFLLNFTELPLKTPLKIQTLVIQILRSMCENALNADHIEELCEITTRVAGYYPLNVKLSTEKLKVWNFKGIAGAPYLLQKAVGKVMLLLLYSKNPHSFYGEVVYPGTFKRITQALAHQPAGWFEWRLSILKDIFLRSNRFEERLKLFESICSINQMRHQDDIISRLKPNPQAISLQWYLIKRYKAMYKLEQFFPHDIIKYIGDYLQLVSK